MRSRSRKLIWNPERKVYEPQPDEEDVVGAIRHMLELNGARTNRIVERIPWGRTTSEPGIPDLSCWFYKPTKAHSGLVFPLHFWVEVKRPGGKLLPSQVAWIGQARADGVIAFFADSPQAVITALRQFGIELWTTIT